MKSNDEKKDDTSSLTDKERRLKTDAVLKELLQIVPPMLPESELKSKPRFIGDMLEEAREISKRHRRGNLRPSDPIYKPYGSSLMGFNG